MQTSLAVARDRIVGILLGLFMMWIVFDQLWESPAGVAMTREVISTLRLLAQLAREPLTIDARAAVDRIRDLRETINSRLDKVSALADGVLFEFGPTREADLAWRRRFLTWLPQLRLVCLTRIGLLKYRLALPGFQLPPDLTVAQVEFDRELGKRIDSLADRLEGKLSQSDDALDQSLRRLEAISRAHEELSPGRGVVSLSHRIERLTASLDHRIRLGP